MPPQKIAAGVRHRGKGRPTTILAPFRDTVLVGLPYEQTKQAEPPIPIPPLRNPQRLSRAVSTSTATTTSNRTRFSPIIINPPLPPPREEHPLFRSQPSSPSSPRSQAEAWKRDSGLAPTSSSVTLREDAQECAEDPIYQKLVDDIADAPSLYSNDDEQVGPSPTSIHRVKPPLMISIPNRADTAETVVISPTQPDQTTSPAHHTSLSKKLSRSFGIGIGPSKSKRLRKKMLGTDRAAPPEPERGSNSTKSPKSPKRQAGTFSSADRGQQDSHSLPSLSPTESFAPINTHIPEDSLWDDFGDYSFSKRGSIMFGGKSNPFKSLMMSSAKQVDLNAPETHAVPVAPVAVAVAIPPPEDLPATTSTNNVVATPEPNAPALATAEKAATTMADSPSLPSIRVSSLEVERESQKVRSLYESGDDLNWEDGARGSFAERLEPTAEVPSEEEENVVSSRPSDSPSDPPPSDHLTPPILATNTPRSVNSLSPLRDSQVRRAAGIEDWDDLDDAEVDRYGFISVRRPVSRAETSAAKSSQFSSRRRNLLIKRPVTSYSSSLSSSLPGGFIRPPSRKVSARSLNTYTSEISVASRRSTRSSIRSATNRLPHNRDRRWMDEAGDMLSLQAGLTGIDDEKTGKALEAQKRKEAERSEKWRKMATAVKGSNTTPHNTNNPSNTNKDAPAQGQGMDYTFDTTNPKLIERTWKGIPDCWRSAAWYAFLSASAQAHGGTETDEAIIAEFARLQRVASPDDVQIDLDVPRTVNGHIMFRRRYRGGQRLLFRVLHAISLYFPETGYVQGMASLAATLLCYFDEERCFVMMVRLWRYRGLERLYRPGFAGLMAALKDFEGRWLRGKDVASKLDELAIDATAYGTRWYLTLFNLSIPFAAQLRIWDVFMLLGECPPDEPFVGEEDQHGNTPALGPPPKGLDILHAASAALIHALRDVLLDSDFENAMKALTAWIPVKDEDLLMKVARGEWRRHVGKRVKGEKEKEKKGEKERKERGGKKDKDSRGKEKEKDRGKEKGRG